MSKKFNQYIDEYQNVHIQDKVLGKGGQGVVFRTKDPDLAIKLVIDETGKPVTDKASLEEYARRFKLVHLLPLPEKLNISVPAALLRNNAGYVMQLLSEMVPFKHFWSDDKLAGNITNKDIPLWLSEMPENEAKKIVYYYKTGGLRRRLTALYKCASLLARLHGNGFVYGDISPNNIFISEGLEDSSVWLIDADNIRFETKKAGGAVFTPKYGAPELVQGKDGGRPTSDCYSFAIVAFYLLSLIHPFVGKKADGTGKDDWAYCENDDEDSEEKAYAGLLPWVDDRDDDSNSSNSGLPRPLLLTEKLRSLFERTFGEGRLSPWLRPSIYHWPAALAQASDLTVACAGCCMTYYYDYKDQETGEEKCPYCSVPKPPIIILESYRWNGVGEPLGKPCWRYVREINNTSKLSIPSRVFGDFTMSDSDTEEVIIEFPLGKGILIKKSDQWKIDLYIALENHQQNNFQKVYSQLKIDRSNSELSFWMFACSNSPRLILCSISGGAK